MNDLWKRKLLAYLHDPPHKPRAIAAHEDQRQSFLNRLGLDPDALKEFDRSNDWQAAAADRLVFPDPAKSKLTVDWEANDFEFRHPLGGGCLTPRQFPATAAGMEEAFVSALDGIAPDSDDWKMKFIRSWRLWPERSAREKAAHLAYIVADTRIPDHTLWHHNALASAFTTTGGKPAFLLFQIGPVQDFIAQARKTQDLWSASYLLSFLIAQAMLAVADAIGPDAIVFPQLRGMPLVDFHWWRKGYLGDQKLRASHSNELLTPNLPNRFLALIPASRSVELAALAEDAVRRTWAEIAAKVKSFLDAQLNSACTGWDKHWQAQVNRFPVVDWVVHPWIDTATALTNAANATPPLHGGWEKHPLNLAARWAEEFIPKTERESYGPRSNAGFAWALHFAATDWKFAACKNARAFAQWQPARQVDSDGVPKDHLDGKNEVLGGAEHERFWDLLRSHPVLGEKTKEHPSAERHFIGRQLYGALTVIKRLWVRAYLTTRKDNPDGFFDFDVGRELRDNFKSVIEIASGRRESFFWDEADADLEALQPEESYYAVIAMDGDDMGQWVSGVKAAPLVNSLAEKAQTYFRTHWAKGAEGLPSADEVPRPLSPGYHAALSEALANFSLYCARPIVEAFGGQLIYAGGDDVLAMTPASTALDCAQALQLAFRGVHPDGKDAHAAAAVKRVLNDLFDYSRHTDGFLTLRKSERRDVGRAEHLKPNWPLMVMGPLATVSVGIAIGHVRSPMQDTIQAARDAEHTAKSVTDKGAFCLSILKRSGESASFAAQFKRGVAGVWAELDANHDQLSGRFPYRFLHLIRPLLARSGKDGDGGWEPRWTGELIRSIEAELRHVHYQQNESGEPAERKRTNARDKASHWLGQLVGDMEYADTPRFQPALSPRDFIHFWMAWAFVNRLKEQPDINER